MSSAGYYCEELFDEGTVERSYCPEWSCSDEELLKELLTALRGRLLG